MKQFLSLTNRIHLPFKAQPIRHGVPLPRGAVSAETLLRAADEDGGEIPIASRILNRWPDGSGQWSLLDFALAFGPRATRTVPIHADEGTGDYPLPANPVTTTQSTG